MNNVTLMGRLTADPNTRYTGGENPTCIAHLTLAVDRRKKTEGGQNADFIRCVAFGKTGEFVEKYARKGVKFAIQGRIQTGSYQDKDGKTVYTTEVVIEQVEFAESKGSGSGSAAAPAQEAAPATQETAPADDGFMNVPDDIDEELPFN